MLASLGNLASGITKKNCQGISKRFDVIAVAHGESPHFGISHLKDHVPKLIVVDGGWHIKTSHSLTGPLNSVLYDPPDVSHPRVDVF